MRWRSSDPARLVAAQLRSGGGGSSSAPPRCRGQPQPAGARAQIRRRVSVGGWRQRRWPVDGGGGGAGQRVCGSGGTPHAGAAAATPAAELARATGRGPQRQRSGHSDGGDELVPACGSGLVGLTDFFFVFEKCLPSASFNTRQNFYRVREEKHSAKVPFADVCLPCVVCREQHTANILPWGK